MRQVDTERRFADGQIKVVFDATHDKSCVALISGEQHASDTPLITLRLAHRPCEALNRHLQATSHCLSRRRRQRPRARSRWLRRPRHARCSCVWRCVCVTLRRGCACCYPHRHRPSWLPADCQELHRLVRRACLLWLFRSIFTCVFEIQQARCSSICFWAPLHSTAAAGVLHRV